MIQDTLRKYIAEHQLFDKDSRLLLALSGGGDSMALLHLLLDEGYHFEVAHVNFQLRGQASNDDEALVVKVCQEKGLKLHIHSVDTNSYAQQNKMSIEMAARDIRYDFFEGLMDQHKLDCVAVAHHRNDVVETFFINLMRGTGLRGLSGIAPRNGRVVRPLLSVSHQELITYLEDRNLDYCTDQSNFDTSILRNEIRHQVIPHFEEMKGGFTEIMQRTVGRLRESEAVVDAYVQDWISRYVKEENGELLIPMADLYAAVSPSEILFHILQPKGFSIAVIDELSSQNNKRVGARFEAAAYRLIVDRDKLMLGPKEVEDVSYFIDKDLSRVQEPVPMQLDVIDVDDDFQLIKDSKIALLDADRLTFPLTLRHWCEGDVFCPIGMGGKQKKVSDFFIDKKFSIPQKEKTWLLCSGADIVWIVGHRLDERYKYTKGTKSLLKITL